VLDCFNPVPPFSTFCVAGYRRSTDPPTRPFSAFAFYRPNDDRRRFFPATLAADVAGMVRCLTGKMARSTGHCEGGGNPGQWVNEYVMGHGESAGLRPRFSYLALPSIRPPNVLGDINRVIIAEPIGGTDVHAAWARRTLQGQVLLSKGQKEEAILLAERQPAVADEVRLSRKEQKEEAILLALPPDDWVLRQYTDFSHSWATVTPIVLPGSDDGKFAKAKKLFFKSLRHAGYSPEALAADPEFRNVSFWPGGDLALHFQRPEYLRTGCWSVYHVRLRWKQSIKGPFALGAGRHCGLGIFAGTDE
jgi:CRISPR-associated protein Csb2